MRHATHQLPPFLALLVLAACARAENPPAAPAKPADDVAAKRDAELLTASQTAAIVKDGKATYVMLCQACHGDEKVKGDAPTNLFDTKWVHGGRPSEIEHTVMKGVIDKGMIAWGDGILPPEDVTAVVAYILSQQKPQPK